MDKKELIAQYIISKLSPEAQKEFDDFMITDTDFANEVAFQENLKVVLQKEEHETLKKQLQGFEAEENTSSFNYKKWLVAASVVLLLGVSTLGYFNKSIDTQKLYVEYFEPYRNVVQPIVRGESKTDLKTKAFTAYETKSYQEALQYFDELLKQNPDNTMAFYKANTLLKLDRVEEAVAIFENNLKINDSLDTKNNWYLALAYLKLEDHENAKKHLKIVSINTKSDYKNADAKRLIRQLE